MRTTSPATLRTVRPPGRPPELTATGWLRFGPIRRAVQAVRPQRVLELGTGEGALGAWLARLCDYTGVEPDDRSRAVAAHRLAPISSARLLADLADVGAEPFDLVCAFEVLEHIEDDRGALASWRTHLGPQGHLLLSVPAHADAYGPSDTYVGHFRRYERDALELLLTEEGFVICSWCTYGAGLGQLIDTVRNAILRRKEAPESTSARSGGSGRLYQPRSRLRAYGNYALALPFRAIQRPFARTDTGMGYVVLARLRDGLSNAHELAPGGAARREAD